MYSLINLVSSNEETGEDATEKSASEMETTTAEDIAKYSGEDCMKCGSWNNSINQSIKCQRRRIRISFNVLLNIDFSLLSRTNL